ncbi:MAG: formyltransferase [Gammaproteobacteria bacterium]|nr:formyltransferase [Gammaproteobacteria bacterium]
MTRAVVFAYSEVGARCLAVLIRQGVEIPIVFTHADDPHEHRWFASVAEIAHRHGLRVETPADVNSPSWLEVGRAAAPDFLFSFYYRDLLSPAWLALAPRGALNMHGSLLPKYRGRAPIHWAILHGETETGASLHYMVEKPDAGRLVDQKSVPIGENDTALQVSQRVAEAAEQVLARSLPRLVAGTAEARDLELSRGSYFGRRVPEDGRIDWRLGAKAIHDLVRAVAPPFPGAFCEIGGHRLDFRATRLDPEPARDAGGAPGLYASGGEWFVDCIDGRRLKVLDLAVDGRGATADSPPAPLAQGRLALI